MKKGTRNALLYAAAAYLGYRYYKKQQGKVQQAPSTTAGNEPPTTPVAVKQATSPVVSKPPASPTFGGASASYTKKVIELQFLLGVKADGIVGPITTKAAANYGILYPINSLTIDRALAAVKSTKNKPTVSLPWWVK